MSRRSYSLLTSLLIFMVILTGCDSEEDKDLEMAGADMAGADMAGEMGGDTPESNALLDQVYRLIELEADTGLASCQSCDEDQD